MISEDQLNVDLILSKTYISPTLKNGLDFNKLRNRMFHLKEEQIVDIYQESLMEIHGEYQDYEGTSSEIAFSFSSPTFKVLLYNYNYFDLAENPYSITKPKGFPIEGYDNSTNYLFLNVGEFSARHNMEIFKQSLKENLRHRFHFASKNILHAPFPKRPEVYTPCEILFVEPHPNYSTKRLTLDESFEPYNSIVRTDKLISPIFPFHEKQKKYFTESLFQDIQHLNQTISEDKELRNLIHKHYQPMRWIMDATTLKNKVDLPLTSIMQTLQEGGNFCFKFKTGVSNHLITMNFCIDSFYYQASTQILEGNSFNNIYFSKDKYYFNEALSIESAFINDVNWLVYSSLFQNEQNFGFIMGSSNYFGRESQLDAWLYRIPQNIYRKAFPLLEKIRLEDFQKYSSRAQNLSQCNETPTPSNTALCIENICKKDFIFDAFMEYNVGKINATFEKETNCDFSDGNCLMQHFAQAVNLESLHPEFTKTYFKQSIAVNLNHPEFVKTFDSEFFKKQLLTDNIFDNKCTSLVKFKKNNNLDFSQLLLTSKKLQFFLAGLLAFHDEIGEILGTIMDKAYLSYLRRFPNHPGFNLNPQARRSLEVKIEKEMSNFDTKATHSLFNMQLRSMFDSTTTIFYDMLSHTKEYVKKQNQEKIQTARMLNQIPPKSTFKNTCKNICIGAIRSIAFIGWKYCAGPIIVGTREVLKSVRKGYREEGVLSSMDMGIEAIAEHFIPGGEALLSMQKQLHFEYEQRNAPINTKNKKNKNLKSRSKKQNKESTPLQKPSQEMPDASKELSDELKKLADKIRHYQNEQEDLDKYAIFQKNKKKNHQQSLIVDSNEFLKIKEEERKQASELREKEHAKEKLLFAKKMERLKQQEEISQKHMLSLKEQEPIAKLRTEIDVMTRGTESIEKNLFKLQGLFDEMDRKAFEEKIITCQNLLESNQFSERIQRIIAQKKFKEQNLILLPGKSVQGKFVKYPYDVSAGTLAYLFKRKKLLLKNSFYFIKKFNNTKKASVAWDDHDELSSLCTNLSKILIKCQEYNTVLSKLFENLNKLQEEITTQFELLSKGVFASISENEMKSNVEGEILKKDLAPAKKSRSEKINERRQKQLDLKQTRNEARKNVFLSSLQYQSQHKSQEQSESKILQEKKSQSENLTLSYSAMNGAYGDRTYFSFRTSAAILRINQDIKQYLDEMSEILKILGDNSDNSTSGISRVLANLNLDSLQADSRQNTPHLPRFNGNMLNELEFFAIKSEILAFIYLTSCIMEKIKNSPNRHFFPREIARQFRDAVYHNPEFRSILANERHIKQLIEQRDYMRNFALELVSYMRARLSQLNMTQEQASLDIAKLSSLIFKNHEYKISKKGFISNRRNVCKRKMKECIAYLKLTEPERSQYYDFMEGEIFTHTHLPRPLQKLISSYAEERVLTWYFGEERAKTILNNSFALILGEFGSYFKEYNHRHYKDNDYSWFESEISKYDPEIIKKLRHATVMPQFAKHKEKQTNIEDFAQYTTYSDLRHRGKNNVDRTKI